MWWVAGVLTMWWDAGVLTMWWGAGVLTMWWGAGAEATCLHLQPHLMERGQDLCQRREAPRAGAVHTTPVRQTTSVPCWHEAGKGPHTCLTSRNRRPFHNPKHSRTPHCRPPKPNLQRPCPLHTSRCSAARSMDTRSLALTCRGARARCAPARAAGCTTQTRKTGRR